MQDKKMLALIGAIVAAMVATVAFALPSLAQDDPTVVDEATDEPGSEPEDGGELRLECEALFDELEAAWDSWEPSAEEIAAINAETDALVAFLADNGVEVEVETEDGIRYPQLDEALFDDEHIDDLLDQFFDEYWTDEAFDEEVAALPDGFDQERLDACDEALEAEMDALFAECDELLDHHEHEHEEDYDDDHEFGEEYEHDEEYGEEFEHGEEYDDDGELAEA